MVCHAIICNGWSALVVDCWGVFDPRWQINLSIILNHHLSSFGCSLYSLVTIWNHSQTIKASMGSVLSAAEVHKKKRQKQIREVLATKQSQKTMVKPQWNKYEETRRRALQSEIDRRVEEKDDHTKGHQIWFSRYIYNGRLRHWVLMTHDYKYELRRNTNVGERNGKESSETWRFIVNKERFSIDRMKRDAAVVVTEIDLFEVDDFYFCLIGWTIKIKKEVDDACDSVFQSFETYDLLWNNCQHFFRMVTKRIVVIKAIDYLWFLDNTKTRYQKTQALKPPSEALLLRMASATQVTAQQQVTANNLLQA